MTPRPTTDSTLKTSNRPLIWLEMPLVSKYHTAQGVPAQSICNTKQTIINIF